MSLFTALPARPRSAGQALVLALALAGLQAWAAPSPTPAAPPAPVAAALPPALPAVSNAAWPAPLSLEVDATDLAHRVLQARLLLPVTPSDAARELTLLYPRFLPGAHGPYGDVSRLAGLMISAGGRPVAWQRDTVDPHAYRVQVPAGVSQLELRLQYIAPARRSSERISITRSLLNVEWETVLLYPAGTAASGVRVQTRLKLPPGWQAATALRGPDGQTPAAADAQGWWTFGETSLETLIDSPLFAGAVLRRVALDAPGTAAPVTLNLLADEAAAVAATPAQLDAHRALVRQADRLFGSRPYRHYDFLLAISDEFGGIGLEHHESSENGVEASYFTDDWDRAVRARELLPHEYVHAWNGKFRRPDDLWTANYNQPMRNSLLWVYEGLTQYWGHVLTARAGLSTPEQARDRLAWLAAELQARSGRAWRNLQDTTLDPTVGPGHSAEWEDWQRSTDYYDEGLLLWLDVDTLIREKSRQQHSLDDVARAFFGAPHATNADGSPRPAVYDFDALVQALNAVQPHDWAGFFRDWLDGHDGRQLLDGIERGGWRLVWSTEESRFAQNERGWSGPDGDERPQDLAFSLGLRVTSDGKLEQVFWDSPAFRAGLAPGMTLVAVNDRAYKPERLSAAVTANRQGQAPIRLLVRDGDLFLQPVIDWQGGLRYPVLERQAGKPDRLDAVYKAR